MPRPAAIWSIVKLLLSKGADVKPRSLYTDWPSQVTSEPRTQYRPVGGLNPLMYAIRAGCYSCVDLLIAAGADVNFPTPEGISPLMLALDNERNEIAMFLIDKGAYLDVWDWWGRTPLWIAVDRKTPPGGPVGGGFGGFGGAAVEVPAVEVPAVVAPDLEAAGLEEGAGVAAPRQSAIRMRPLRFRACKSSIGCWLPVSM